MVELAQLFSDMALVVEEQGETLEHIEEKACKAEQDMEAA
jgi:t-SNARE complex subunit (syntaxin)